VDHPSWDPFGWRGYPADTSAKGSVLSKDKERRTMSHDWKKRTLAAALPTEVDVLTSYEYGHVPSSVAPYPPRPRLHKRGLQQRCLIDTDGCAHFPKSHAAGHKPRTSTSPGRETLTSMRPPVKLTTVTNERLGHRRGRRAAYTKTYSRIEACLCEEGSERVWKMETRRRSPPRSATNGRKSAKSH
jgi:hypothetical protein